MVNFVMSQAPGWAAFGAETAMQAEILVLGHHATGLDRLQDIDRLRKIERGHYQRSPQLDVRRVEDKRNAIDRAHVDAGVALDAQRRGKDGLDVAIETALCFAQSLFQVEAKLDLGFDVLERHRVLDMGDLKRRSSVTALSYDHS
jgi:hypothetical protein